MERRTRAIAATVVTDSILIIASATFWAVRFCPRVGVDQYGFAVEAIKGSNGVYSPRRSIRGKVTNLSARTIPVVTVCYFPLDSSGNQVDVVPAVIGYLGAHNSSLFEIPVVQTTVESIRFDRVTTH